MNYEKSKYFFTQAYAQSKLCNNLFTHALADKIPDGKGIAISLHPGVVRTELFRYGITGWLVIIFKILYPIYKIFTKSAKEGAQTTIFTLFTPAEKLKNGGYHVDCHLSS